MNTSRVNITQPEPMAMIERRYGNGDDDRYGLGQWPNGALRMYTSSLWKPATINLSLARPNNQFYDVVTIDNDRNVAIRTGNLNVGDQGTDDWRAVNLTNKRGFWHVSGPRAPENDDMAIFYKPHDNKPDTWKETIRFKKDGAVVVPNKLCMSNTCITPADLERITMGTAATPDTLDARLKAIEESIESINDDVDAINTKANKALAATTQAAAKPKTFFGLF